MSDSVALGGPLGGGEKCRAAAAGAPVARTDDETAALGQQRLARLRFEFPPDLVRPQNQRHIGFAFANRLPGDARFPVGRSAIVRRRMAVDANGIHTAPCKLVERRRSHGAKANHRHVIGLGPARHRHLPYMNLSHPNQKSGTSATLRQACEAAGTVLEAGCLTGSLSGLRGG